MDQKTTSHENSQQTPWAGQTGYITDAFNNAQNTFNTQRAAPGYTGNLIAGLTPEQVQNFQTQMGYAGSAGNPAYSGNVANGALGSAGALGGASNDYNARAGGLFNLAGNTINEGAGTTASGVNAMSGAITGLNNYTPTGGTQDNINAAASYADNPFMSGMVSAAMRDANRNATENQLPGIAREAAASGNIGSSKRGIAEGIVTRALNDQAGDISSALRGDAYKTGLSLSENARQFNNSAMLDALKSSGSIGGTMAGVGVGQIGAGTGVANAATGAGNLGLGYANSSMDASRLGLTANNMQQAQQAGLFDIANSAGAGIQHGNQLALDNSRSQIEYQNQTPWDQLSRYYGIVGANNWGNNKSGTSTQETAPSPWAVAGGLIGAGTSMFGANGFGMLQPAGKALTGKLFG